MIERAICQFSVVKYAEESIYREAEQRASSRSREGVPDGVMSCM